MNKEVYQVTADDGEDKYTWLFVAKDSDDACYQAKRNLVETFKEFTADDETEWSEHTAVGFIEEFFQIQSCKVDKKW